MQISGRILPSKYISKRDGVSLDIERRGRVVAVDYFETNTVGDTGFVEKSEPKVAGAVAGIRDVYARSDGV